MNVSVGVSGEKVGEKVPVVALVPVAVEKTTPKKQPIPVQFNTLTRSSRKRQEEELIRVEMWNGNKRKTGKGKWLLKVHP